MPEKKKTVPFLGTITILYYSLVCTRKFSKSKCLEFMAWTLRLMSFVNLCVFPLHHLITSIRDGIAVDISENISSIVGGGIAIVLIILFKSQEQKWYDLLDDVVDFTGFEKHPKFDEFTKKMNRISFAAYGVYYINLSMYATVVYNSTGPCTQMNRDLGLHEYCGSFTAIRLPFENNSLRIRLAIFLTQMALNSNALMSAAHITFLVYEMTLYLDIHIELLKQKLLHIFDEGNHEEVSRRFGYCIRYHNHILRLIYRFNNIAKFTIGQLTLTAAVIMACIGNQILKGTPMAGMAYFQGYIIELFFLCHSGQIIMDQTESIGYTLYESKWYESESKLMRNMVLVLRRCQVPMTLQALPQGDLNYPFFLMMMNSAYTYFTLLAQTT